MKRVKVIKTRQGRVTVQINSFSIPEIKVRHNGETHIIQCHYGETEDVIKIVELLLDSNKI